MSCEEALAELRLEVHILYESDVDLYAWIGNNLRDCLGLAYFGGACNNHVHTKVSLSSGPSLMNAVEETAEVKNCEKVEYLDIFPLFWTVNI